MIIDEIRVDDNPQGHGAVFVVSLPFGETQVSNVSQEFVTSVRSEALEAPSPSSNTEKTKGLRHRNVIVVEDDATIRSYVHAELSADMNVTEFGDGQEGWDYVVKNPDKVDLVISDVMMPVMDGVETLKRIRSMTDFPCESTPIIALTANAIVGSREKYIEAGFDDYMSKPVNGQKLEELLRKYIPSKKIQFVTEEELKSAKSESLDDEASKAVIEEIKKL